MTSGSLPQIFKLFITPLLRYRQAGQQTEGFLEELFHVDYRRIDRFEVIQSFKIPGITVGQIGRPTPTLKAGELVLVRADSRDDFVELQPISREEYYRFSIKDFLVLKPKLKKLNEERKYNYY